MTDAPDETDDDLDELDEITQLEEVHDLPWRDRVVARSLGAAQRQSLDRASALMKATVELLEISGESVTVQDVADRAGVSLRILYRHFSSKDDLLAAVLEERLEEGAQAVRAALRKIDDPIERIAEFIRLTVDHESTPLNLALAKNETRLLLSHPAEVARAQEPMALLGRELVQQAVDAGRIDPAVAEHGLYCLMALKRSFNRAQLLGDHFGFPLPDKEEIVRYSLRGLGVAVPS